ncbi:MULTISPECIES: hypothetical protein [unclassified Streptomyces]|uniref:hypothetical protein n=1 Tax=unclassified Streptomyces TaxID=2593676 RepID=UPI0003689F1B|nr:MULTISPECIES: hypothetical protein [unclassified Streptomyces]MYX36749.1 hypothetical protein [Streptomyces sp. SID8377]
MPKITFVDTLPGGAARGPRPTLDHADIATQLEAHSTEWGKVAAAKTPAAAYSLAQRIKTAHFQAYEPAGSFEAAARTIQARGAKPEFHVYTRYVG